MKNLDHIKSLKQLLRVTIDDVKLVKKDDRYRFNVTKWHEPNTLEEECAVCLGGSIMAKTLGVDMNKELLPSDFDKRTRALFYLINGLRRGEDVIYLLDLLTRNREVFDLNNLDSLDLNNYDLKDGDIDKWEKLYSDLV